MSTENLTHPPTDDSVTQEEYQAAIQALGTYLCDFAATERWCGARHQYFRAIMPEYDRSNYGGEYEGSHAPAFEPDFTQTPEQPYSESLRQIRARILWYVRNTHIVSLEEANEAFTLMGLPHYPNKGKTLARFTVYPPSITVSAANADMSVDQIRDWLASHFGTIVQNRMNGIETDSPNHLVPGSFEWNGTYYDVYKAEDDNVPVMESDTIRPDNWRQEA